jgi:hypothetical protein
MQPLPYHAGLAVHLLWRLQLITALAACCCPFCLSTPGKPLTQKLPSKFLPAAPGIQTVRDTAHTRVP